MKGDAIMKKEKKILVSLLFLMFLPAILFADDGALDTSFNGTGYALYNSEPDPGSYGEDYGNAVAIQSDGKIVVVGHRAFDFNEDVLILRYKIDGTLDGTFGTAGGVTYHCGIDYCGARGKRVAIQSDGKIVVAGYTRDGTNRDVLVL